MWVHDGGDRNYDRDECERVDGLGDGAQKEECEAGQKFGDLNKWLEAKEKVDADSERSDTEGSKE